MQAKIGAASGPDASCVPHASQNLIVDSTSIGACREQIFHNAQLATRIHACEMEGRVALPVCLLRRRAVAQQQRQRFPTLQDGCPGQGGSPVAVHQVEAAGPNGEGKRPRQRGR
jgi:hypothetical protein